MLEKKSRFSHHGSRRHQRAGDAAETWRNPMVIRIIAVQEGHKRPGVEEERLHLRQFRSRISSRSGWGSPMVFAESTQPIQSPARSPNGRESRSRCSNSRMYSDSLLLSACAVRFSASRCLTGNRMGRVMVCVSHQ